MRLALTLAQRETLSTIARLTKQLGYPPSFREINAARGVSGTNGLFQLLGQLERRGLAIRPDRKTCRAIHVTPEGHAALEGFALLLPRRCRDCRRVTFEGGACRCGCEAFEVEAA